MSLMWATREGKYIEIIRMTDQHLLNTMKWLERNNFKRKFFYGGFDGDGTPYGDYEIEDMTKHYLAMKVEKETRGLK